VIQLFGQLDANSLLHGGKRAVFQTESVETSMAAD
jgi:hypothetical protein